MGEIIDAVIRAETQAEAAGLSPQIQKGDEATMRRAYSGTDLDFEELWQVAYKKGLAGALGLQQGSGLLDVIAGCWADGVMVGVLIERARRGD